MAIQLVAEVPCLFGHFPLASTLHIVPYKSRSTAYWERIHIKVPQNTTIQKPQQNFIRIDLKNHVEIINISKGDIDKIELTVDLIFTVNELAAV